MFLYSFHYEPPDVTYTAIFLIIVQTCTLTHVHPGKGTLIGTIPSGRCFLQSQCNLTQLAGYNLSVQATMTPTPSFHAYPGLFCSSGVRKHSAPLGLEVEGKRSAMTIVLQSGQGQICQGKYIVTWTKKFPPLYRLTGCLTYNPVGNTWRLLLLDHIPN